ncbi:MAG: hypothetical protein N2423_04625 [Novosphingobium sp.]|nr:hypothetical protein [Novosphingobium sp.]
MITQLTKLEVMMSDRLALSATLSVLMMSIYVLFGNGVARLPIGPEQLATRQGARMLALPAKAGRLILSAD